MIDCIDFRNKVEFEGYMRFERVYDKSDCYRNIEKSNGNFKSCDLLIWW